MSHKVSSISKSVMQEQQACATCGQPGSYRPTYAAALTSQKTHVDLSRSAQNLDGGPTSEDDWRYSTRSRSSENKGRPLYTNDDGSRSMSSQEARQILHEQQLAVAINPNANPLSPATETKSQELNRAYGGLTPYSQAPRVFSPNDPMQGENKKSCSGLDLNTRTPAYSQQHMTGGIHAASATVRRETGDSLQGSQVSLNIITI